MIVRAVGGEPATGKSTVMVEAMKLRAPWDRFKYGLVAGHINEIQRLIVIGIYEAGQPFPGTDRLSMAAAPAVIKWLRNTSRLEPYTVLFEGDRLFSLNFLLQLVQFAQVEVTVLVASNLSLEMRHANRKDSQKEGFLRGRKTKIDKILRGFPCNVEINERLSDTERIARHLVR